MLRYFIAHLLATITKVLPGGGGICVLLSQILFNFVLFLRTTERSISRVSQLAIIMFNYFTYSHKLARRLFSISRAVVPNSSISLPTTPISCAPSSHSSSSSTSSSTSASSMINWPKRSCERQSFSQAFWSTTVIGLTFFFLRLGPRSSSSSSSSSISESSSS